MDRLNDDCVGLVLSYLSLQDKFRLECVSKQWKRNIFLYVDRIKIVLKDFQPIRVGVGSYKREYDFYFPDRSSMMTIPSNEKSNEVLRMIFAKCENIETVEFESLNSPWFSRKVRINPIIETSHDIESVLAIIANHCHGLSYFRLIYDQKQQSFNVFKHFFIVCGHKLKKLDLLQLHNWQLGSVLSPCMNLEDILSNCPSQLMSIFEEEQGFFPRKLRAIDGFISPFDLDINYEIDSRLFHAFCEKYKSSVKRIKLWIHEGYYADKVSRNQLLHLFHLLDQFTKLEFISLKFSEMESDKLSESEWNEVKQMNFWSKVKELEIYNLSPSD